MLQSFGIWHRVVWQIYMPSFRRNILSPSSQQKTEHGGRWLLRNGIACPPNCTALHSEDRNIILSPLLFASLPGVFFIFILVACFLFHSTFYFSLIFSCHSGFILHNPDCPRHWKSLLMGPPAPKDLTSSGRIAEYKVRVEFQSVKTDELYHADFTTSVYTETK
jgi:hypothetical protein